MDKLEEMAAWAKSLKPGDKVIFQSGWCYNDLSVLEVEKVTPAGWVKTTNNMTFSKNSYGSMYARGRDIGRIVSVTDELLQKAQKQDAERKENENLSRL